MPDVEPNPHVAENNASNLPRDIVAENVALLRDRFREGTTPHQLAVEALEALERCEAPELSPVAKAADETQTLCGIKPKRRR